MTSGQLDPKSEQKRPSIVTGVFVLTLSILLRKEATRVVMATTRLMKLHIGCKSMAQSMKDSYAYGKNKDKTRGGELIRSYMCDPETADAEFLLSKAKYKSITGREQKRDADVLSYQIRQSFLPGETDPETALNIGYDLAMRWTKGRHAYFVVSHIDRPHPHVHIYYNSTTLDCTHKFRDFKGSARALRRLSDRICLENDLSVITDPKMKSKGQFKHYGHWLGVDKQPSFQERLKSVIDAVLRKKPEDFDTFLALMQTAGYEYKWGRGGVLSFRTDGQERYTRLRASTLDDGYDIEDIKAIICGRGPTRKMYPIATSRKVNLIIDIQEKLREGKGSAYAKWATLFNLKQMAAALQFLQENNLLVYDDLAAKAEAVTERCHNIGEQIKKTESAMKHNADLKAAIVDYARTRPIFEEYKSKKYSNKFLAEHEADIAVYRAAQASIKELLNGEKLLKMETLKAQWQTLSKAKKSGYSEYREAQRDMREVIAVKSNIDYLLGLTSREKNNEMER